MSGEKVLGMSLLGVVKSDEPWKRAHEIGMKELAEKSGMTELIEKSQDEDYFDLVKEALGKIDEYKDLGESERITKRRDIYFGNVLKVLREGNYFDREFVSFVRELKEDYFLVLITTNTRGFVDEVLEIAEVEGLFDEIVTLDSSDEDDKNLVFDKAIEKIGKIDLFIGSEKSGDTCEKKGIEFIKYEGVEKLREVLNE